MKTTDIRGILNVLKPPGMTSFDVIAYLRKITSIKKMGHGGTLDPAAAGVLPVCLGRATKAVEFIMDSKKSYRAWIIPGVITDTRDYGGKVLEKNPYNFDKGQFLEVLSSFRGEILQTPPLYSAIKVGGKKLYEYAREGIEIEPEKRRVVIYSLNPLVMDGENILIDVICSRGTYIRSLCHDIGQMLGYGACMGFLLRRACGDFTLNNSHTLEEIGEAARRGDLDRLIMPVEDSFPDLSSIYISGHDQKKYENGNTLLIGYDTTALREDRPVKVFGGDKRFIGLGDISIKHDKIYLKSKKMF